MSRGPALESEESSGHRRTPNYNWSMQLLGTSSGQATDVSSGRSVRDAGMGSSPAPFDETLPFPPPPHRAARSVEAQRVRSEHGLSLEQITEASLARAGAGETWEPASPASETPVQTALTPALPGQLAPGRLHWRGRELSPEFHDYALRVSRGENLAPFRGKLLADESQPLPWESDRAAPLRSKAPRAVGLVAVALALVGFIAGSVRQDEAPAWAPAAAVMAPLTVVPPAAAAQPVTVQAIEPPQPAASAVQTQVGAVEANSPPPTVASSPAALPVAPAPKPRRAPPAPAAAAAAPGTSVLLVEKPPF